jgi:hypothetical protein
MMRVKVKAFREYPGWPRVKKVVTHPAKWHTVDESEKDIAENMPFIFTAHQKTRGNHERET